MLLEIRFGSFLLYPSKPETKFERQLKNFLLGLKQDRPDHAKTLAQRIKTHGGPLLGFLDGAYLVPVPRSAPLYRGGVWPARTVAEALMNEGLGREVVPLLERVKAVPPSHSQEGSERPWPDQHQGSLRVQPKLPLTFEGRLMLVDDILTRGSTMLGCARSLATAYPGAGEIAGFAAARTISQTLSAPSAMDPVVGRISQLAGRGWIDRDP